MKFSAIITDLDGTAVDSPGQKIASSRLAHAVQALEAKGIKVCAATGRAETFAGPVLETMKLVQPAIIAGGTRIIDPVTKREIWRCGLSDSRIKEIITIMKHNNYGCLWNDYTESDYLDGGWNVDTYTASEPAYFFEVTFVPNKHAQALADKLEAIGGITATLVVAQKPGMNDIHVTNSAATKEHAIYELGRIIGVSKAEMIGIGDGHNDLHLYNAVGYKIAMGNAVDELKEHADRIIGNVKGDGLAEYFEELLKELES